VLQLQPVALLNSSITETAMLGAAWV